MAPMEHQTVDVAIIGGGPAGLAAACAIRRRCPHLRVLVFDRGPAVPRKGAALAIYPNGVAALTSISSELATKLWSRASTKPMVSQAVDKDDNVVSETRMDWGPNKPETQMMEYIMAWYELTQTLFEDQPEGSVRFNHQLTGLQLPDSSSAPGNDGDGYARLTFANGATCEAKLVLGCDGLQSPVRKACMPSATGPTFRNRVNVRGRIDTHVLKQLPSWREVEGRRYLAGTGHFSMVYPAGDETTVWVINAPYSTIQERGIAYQPYGATPKATPGGTSGTESGVQDGDEYDALGVLAEAKKLADAFAPSLLEVMEACDADSVTLNGIYCLPLEGIPEGEFGSGMVTLLGDAAHSMPIAGQGANLAVEDAAVLAYYLQKHGLCESALRAYEADRAPRWRKVAAHIHGMMAAQAQAKNAQDLVQTQKKLGKGGSLEYLPEVHAFHHPCLLEPADAVVAAA